MEDPGPAFISEIYPNPNTGSFTLSIRSKTKENIGIKMLNSLNIQVFEEKDWVVSGKMQREFDFTKLPAGIYFMELERKEGIMIFKILIQK